MHTLTDPNLLNDIAEIGRIEAVPRILETVAHITGSRFTAIARVTETTWTACATLDTLGVWAGSRRATGPGNHHL